MNDTAYPSTTERVKSWVEACPGRPDARRGEGE